MEFDDRQSQAKPDLRPSKEGTDYYFEHGYMVLTEGFLKRRGFCCESGCRHCPYGFTAAAADHEGNDKSPKNQFHNRP